jgi:uncharacterized delta-60 repeat protein
MKNIASRGIAAVAFLLLAGFGSARCHAQSPGNTDPDFGIGGRRTHDFHDRDDRIHGILPLKDGRFLAAGHVVGPNIEGPGSSANFTVARFLPDGRIDPGFGTDGRFELDLAGGVDHANAITLLPDRSIIAIGNLSEGSHSDIGIVKLRANGQIDTMFGLSDGQGGRTGWNLVDPGGVTIHDEGVAVAMQRTGKIIVAGITLRPHGNFMYRRVAILRFNIDGSLDSDFGLDGVVVLDPFQAGDGSDYVTGIAVDQNGRLAGNDSITVIGHTSARNTTFVARLTAEGDIDTSFGSAGSGRITLSSSVSGGVYSGLSTLAGARLVRDGKIALVGSAGDRGITFMRLMANGAIDTSFGSQGRTTIKFSDASRNDEPMALAVQGNGRLVAAGYATNAATGAPHKDFFVARINADGSPDLGFGDGLARAVIQVAVGEDEAYALAVEPSGKLLAGGYALRDGTSQHDFAMLRLHGDKDRLFFHDFEMPLP